MNTLWRFGAGLSLATAGLALAACGGEGGARPDRLHGGGTPYDGAVASLTCQDNPSAEYPGCYTPDPGSGPFDCTAVDGLEFLMLEDFETGVAADGAWYTNNEICYRCVLMQYTAPDGGILPNSYPIVPVIPPDVCADRCAASQDPTHFLKPIPAAEIQNGGRCGSRFAMRLRGPLQFGPFTDWGMTLGRQMVHNPFNAPANNIEGVAFWARVGPASRGIVRFAVADQFTDQDYIDPSTGRAKCLSVTSIDQYVDGGSTSGCDQAGTYVTVGPDWKLFTLPLDEMRQAGWGAKAPFLDKWAILAMTFNLGPGAWWDIWIDDVAWYRRKP